MEDKPQLITVLVSQIAGFFDLADADWVVNCAENSSLLWQNLHKI